MFKYFLLGLLLITSSLQAMEGKLLTWDDRELGTGLHVSSKGYDKDNNPWTVREIQIEDCSFYQGLLSDPNVMKNFASGTPLATEKAAEYVETWVNRFKKGVPHGRMTIVQDEKPVGSVQLAKRMGRPGVGELARAFASSAQGKGLGTAALKFVVEEWAPALRRVALRQDKDAPFAAIDKFQCFEGKELKMIYTTASPSNPASWSSYKHFDFYPSPPAEKNHQISCKGWEESQHDSLEKYILDKHFSSTASDQLQADVLYDMLDDKENPRTLSFVSKYESLRYHFEREVK